MQSSCTDPLSRELSVLKLALALTQVLRTYISLLCLTILMLMAARWACDGQRRRDSSAAAGCSRIYAQCDFGADQAKAFRARGNSPADGDCSCYNVRFQEYLVIRSDVIISASLNGVRRLMRYLLHLISRGLPAGVISFCAPDPSMMQNATGKYSCSSTQMLARAAKPLPQPHICHRTFLWFSSSRRQCWSRLKKLEFFIESRAAPEIFLQ
jgi:hypothetical protein